MLIVSLDVSVCLALRGGSAHRHAVESELDVVAVRTGGGVAQYGVAGPRRSEVLGQTAFRRIVLAGIAEAGLFVALGYGAVVGPENLFETRYVLNAARRYVVARYLELGFEGIEERAVGAFLFEQAVALFQGMVVSHEGVEIRRVALRYDLIDETAPFGRLASDKRHVGRRQKHQRKGAYVLGEALVCLASALERFRAAGLYGRRYFLVEAATQVTALQHGEAAVALHEHGVCRSGKAFAETHEVEGIEQIALSHAVIAEETVDFRRKP